MSAVSCAFSLFVSPCLPSRQISKYEVSFFLWEVISGAGAICEDVGTPLRAHSIRVATSTVFMLNWSVSKVLEATYWRSNSVFASFYLRDIQYSLKGCIPLSPSSRLGPLLILLNIVFWVVGFW